MNTPLQTAFFAASALSAAALATSSYGGEIVVPTDLPLSAAVATSLDGDVITILPGTYVVVPEISFSGKALTIQGSTGDPADVVLDGLNFNVVLRIGAGSSGTLIQDLTITKGYTNTPNFSTSVVGAGLAIENAGNLTVRNCVFTDNHADGSGTGIGDGRGGAIGMFGTNSTIIDCVFTNNQASDAGADGGAVWLNTGTHLVSRCTFTGNSSVDTGGGLRLDDTVAQVTACTFEGNSCVNWGGAIWTRTGADTTIDSCRFTGNTADAGGAVHTYTDSSSTLMRNCLFEGNSAGTEAGAVWNGQPMTIINSTFVNNTSAGSRQSVGAATAGELDIYNSVFWNATPVGDHIIPAADVRYSIVQSGYTGTGNLDADPGLDADFLPAAGSPAIDAANTTLYFGPMVDLDGGVRGTDDPDTADTGASIIGPVVDMGALELQVDAGGPPNDCAADLNGDDVVNVLDLLLMLGAWGGC